jgi:putative hydrolase of HD superfamily
VPESHLNLRYALLVVRAIGYLGVVMKDIVNFLFRAKMLKQTPRSGFQFLGVGKESVAEHTFSASIIAYVMSQLESDADALKLMTMCLLHDLPETTIGDLNYVQKQYVAANEKKAVHDMTINLPFGKSFAALIEEFNSGTSIEAKLARDADQIALILDLKALSDIGYHSPGKWLPFALKRLNTEVGRRLAEIIMETDWDEWWLENYVDRPDASK